MSVQDFLAAVNKHGIARTNRYDVTIHELNRVMRGNENELRHFVSSVTLPGRDIQTNRIQLSNRAQALPNDFSFDGVISISYYVDSTHIIKYAFEEWMKYVVNSDDYTIGYHDDYVSDMTIRVLDYQLDNPDDFNNPKSFKQQLIDKFKQVPDAAPKFIDAPVAIYDIINAYPVKISSINLSNDARNSMMQLNVDLAFERMNSSYIYMGDILSKVNQKEKVGDSVFDKMKDKLTGFVKDKALDASGTAGGIVKSLDPKKWF